MSDRDGAREALEEVLREGGAEPLERTGEIMRRC